MIGLTIIMFIWQFLILIQIIWKDLIELKNMILNMVLLIQHLVFKQNHNILNVLIIIYIVIMIFF